MYVVENVHDVHGLPTKFPTTYCFLSLHHNFYVIKTYATDPMCIKPRSIQSFVGWCFFSIKKNLKNRIRYIMLSRLSVLRCYVKGFCILFSFSFLNVEKV